MFLVWCPSWKWIYDIGKMNAVQKDHVLLSLDYGSLPLPKPLMCQHQKATLINFSLCDWRSHMSSGVEGAAWLAVSLIANNYQSIKVYLYCTLKHLSSLREQYNIFIANSPTCKHTENWNLLFLSNTWSIKTCLDSALSPGFTSRDGSSGTAQRSPIRPSGIQGWAKGREQIQ